MRIQYTARNGSRIKQADAQEIGAELARIAKEHGGRIVPRFAVDDAASPEARLHRHFNWDQADAADQYRLIQATHLICCIVQQVPREGGQEPIEVRAFHHVTGEDEEPAFVTLNTAFSQPDYRQQILDRALRKLESVQQQYQVYEELAGIREAIQDARAALKRRKSAKAS